MLRLKLPLGKSSDGLMKRKHLLKKGGAVGAMPPTHYLSKPGGGRGGLGGVSYKDRAQPPPPPGTEPYLCWNALRSAFVAATHAVYKDKHKKRIHLTKRLETEPVVVRSTGQTIRVHSGPGVATGLSCLDALGPPSVS